MVDFEFSMILIRIMVILSGWHSLQPMPMMR